MSFIWYYYAYDISQAILDLDQDLRQKISFLVTLSVLRIQTCMIPLMKAVLTGFISFSYIEELQAVYGDIMTQKLKNTDFLLVMESFLHIESCVIPLLGSSHKGLHFFLYTDEH